MRTGYLVEGADLILQSLPVSVTVTGLESLYQGFLLDLTLFLCQSIPPPQPNLQGAVAWIQSTTGNFSNLL